MIKIAIQRDVGNLYHYAHFICDCLFCEINAETYKHNAVVRKKCLEQTLGNFWKIYEEVTKIKNLELPRADFDKLEAPQLILNKRHYLNKKSCTIFRDYIFARYNMDGLSNDANYPEVLLIQRGERLELIDDEELRKLNTEMRYITNGRERREIANIEILKTRLQKLFSHTFKTVMLENETFEEQVKYFNHAKTIILAHGAALSNMFFCKRNTNIIEVTCNRSYGFFDIMSSLLELNHIKSHDNDVDAIMKIVNGIPAPKRTGALPSIL